MADTVAIVSIVSGATVAIGSVLINAALENQRIKQRVADARRQELGDLLDGSVQHFWAAYKTLFAIRVGPEPGEVGWSPDKMREFGEELDRHLDVVVADSLRVGLRTPRGADIARVHGAADRVIREYEAEYREYLEYNLVDDLIDDKTPPTPPDEELFGEMRKLRQAIRDYVGVVEPHERRHRRWPVLWFGRFSRPR